MGAVAAGGVAASRYFGTSVPLYLVVRAAPRDKEKEPSVNGGATGGRHVPTIHFHGSPADPLDLDRPSP